MKELLSPKQVASSIGVSESSLKRWCDQGVINTERTPGGHRRIRIGEVVRFLRENQQPLVKPELLGLPSGAGASPRTFDKASDALNDALMQGHAEQARRLVIDLYLAGSSLVKVCEELVTPAMHEIGEGWQCGRVDIYQEHRACEMLNRVLYDLRTLLPPTEPGAPLAMGGTPPGDNYRLASMMVELVLVEAGWEAMSLGASLPFETLTDAAVRHEPELFWLSFSHVENADETRVELKRFFDATPPSMQIVIGGREAPIAADDAKQERVHHCGGLADLQQVLIALSERS